MSVNLLPDVKFVETDVSKIEAEVFSTYESVTGRKLYPADPERLFGDAFACVIAHQRALIEYAARMNFLYYAKGDYLDHLGYLLGVYRLPAQPARTTLKFEIGEPLTFPVAIPKGTRVTPDGKLFFATLSEARIEPGKVSVEVEAECMEPGTVGNGFLPGQINKLVDPVPYITKVENTSVSFGGSDVESDDHFRERIRLAPETFSNAGSREAYIYWIKSTDPNIVDAEVWSPSPGVVKATFLMKGGELPSEDMLSKVQEFVSDEKRRPLTDFFQVQMPEVVSYEIKLTYWIYRSAESLASQIMQAVNDAVQAYIAWQKTKLGRDITPSVLISYVQGIEGIKRVEVESPAYQALDPWQVARETSVSVIYGGVEEE